METGAAGFAMGSRTGSVTWWTMTVLVRGGQVACVAHLGVEAKSADDRAGVDLDGAGLFEERFEGEANVLAATPVYSRGMGVAINRGAVGDAVVFGDVVGTAPAEEFDLDGLAVGMLAYVAAA